MFNKKDKPIKFKAEKKERGYDEHYKHPINKKKIALGIGAVLAVILLAAVIFVAVQFFDKINKEPTDIIETPIVTDVEEEYYNNLSKSLSNGTTIGLTTKDDLKNAGIINEEISGENYLIKNGYTNINNIDYFTTYLFEDNILVGIVHEAMLDTTTKYNLATKFQTITSELNRAYSQMEISRRWFVEQVKYDSAIWNEMLVNNELELVAELAKGSEFVKVVASGVPYFDYRMDNDFDQTFGNLVIIYSNGANQDLFKQIDEISFT